MASLNRPLLAGACFLGVALDVTLALSGPASFASIRSAAAALAVSHALVGALAWRAHPGLDLAWRIHSTVAGAWGALSGWQLLTILTTLHGLHDGFPNPLTQALALGAGATAFATLPVAAWGLVRWHRQSQRHLPWWGAGALVVLGAWRLMQLHGSAGGVRSIPIEEDFVSAIALESPLAGLPPASRERTARSWSVAPIACRKALDAAATAFVGFVSREPDGDPLPIACLQADSLSELAAVVRLHLDDHAADGPMWIELVDRTAEFTRVEGLQLRRGDDGACSAVACLLPWQLEARGTFRRYTGLGQELAFDLSPSTSELAQALESGRAGSLAAAPLVRFTTRRWATSGSGAPLRPEQAERLSRSPRRGTR